MLCEDHHRKQNRGMGGMTSVLQPLDVSVNKPMKTILQLKWSLNGTLMVSTPTKRGGKCGNQNCMRYLNESAWQELDCHVIKRAFKKFCISNNMDGTEDDILFEELIQKCDSPSIQHVTDDYDLCHDNFYTDVATHKVMTEEELNNFYVSDSDTDFEGFDKDDLLVNVLRE